MSVVRSAERDVRLPAMALGILAAVSFLLPKIGSQGLAVGLGDMAAALLAILGLSAGQVGRTRIFAIELVYAAAFTLYGTAYGVLFSDIGSFLICFRTGVYVLAGAGLVALLTERMILKAIQIISLIVMGYYVWPLAASCYKLATGQITLFSFLWDYGSGRLTAPYETGTSSVPLGYAFSIFLIAALRCAPALGRSSVAALSFLYLIAAALTASRAAILSCCVTLALAINWKGLQRRPGLLFVVGAFALLLAVPLLLLVVSKTFIDGELDPSGSQRLLYYGLAFQHLFDSATSLLFGNGVSELLLETRTGTSFYESLLVNSLIQGGVLLFIPATLLLAQFAVLPFRAGESLRGLAALAAAVVVGNLIGGANYFSPYVYIVFALLKADLLLRHDGSPHTQKAPLFSL